MKIKSKRIISQPLQLYDAVNVEPNNNFSIQTKSGKFIISHNSKGADIHFEQNKVLNTYNACFGRIKNRFTINGKCQGRMFLVSSKKTEYDFLNQYIERKMQSEEDSKNLYVADAKAFEVKPKGSYSGKMFRVAVGGANLPSKIPTDEETTEELIHQGYEVYEAPVELRGDFELDINRFIADHLGISVSEVIKFIPYNKVEACYKEGIQNPVSHEVIMANLADDIPISTYFKPEIVPEVIYRKPIFIHIDTSGGKTDNCGITGVAAMGYVYRNRYSEETGNEETTKQMLYRHVFSLGANARKDTEISFQKIVDFLWYLKFKLGWNIKAVSTDGYMGQFLRQQIAAAGFKEVNYVSLDRSPDGYLALQSILAEKRIALIKLDLLESELVRLERNNVSGKIDHPLDGCFTGDTRVMLTNGSSLTMVELKNAFERGEDNYVYTCNEDTFEIEPKRIMKAFKTKRDRIVTIRLSNDTEIRCTANHRFLMIDGSYKEAMSLNSGDELMSATFYPIYVKTIVQTNGDEEDVYDLTIEDTPNFALDAGVFVHNSKDIADSLAGALYNAMQHEKDIKLGGEDLIESVVEENITTSVPNNAKVRPNQVNADEVNKILNELKQSQQNISNEAANKLARRQAFINQMKSDEMQYGQSDIDDGFLI